MRKKCKRKVWSTTINPIAHAISGAAVADDASLNKLRLCELSAIDAMTKGMGTPHDFRWICDVLNIGETMGKAGIGPEILPFCKKAQEALLEAKDRFDKTGKLILSGVGIKAVKEVWMYHEAQRTSISRSEYEKMIKKTADYIRSHGKNVVEIV